jgi:hypothetical protein
MNGLTIFFTEISISLVLSLLTLLVLSKPLINILEDLCPTQKQAAFWLVYTRVMLFISPLLLVLIVSVMAKSNNEIESIKISLIAALAGLLLGMLIVGKKIFEPAKKLNGCEVQ